MRESDAAWSRHLRFDWYEQRVGDATGATGPEQLHTGGEETVTAHVDDDHLGLAVRNDLPPVHLTAP